SEKILYEYVAAHFKQHGTDPKDIELEKKVSDYLSCVEYAFDKDKDPLVFSAINEILNALPGKEATEKTALEKVQRWIEKSFRSTQTKDGKKIQAFHEIHTLYQETLRVRLLFVLAGKGDEMQTFLEASQAYFEAINDSESDTLPDAPEALMEQVKAYKKILDTCKEDRMKGPIENFFADWFTAMNTQDITSLKDLYVSLLDASFQKKIVLTDQEITRFIESCIIESKQSGSSNENENENENEVEVDPYWINRVFLHAIIVPPKDWSRLFAETFRELRAFVENHFNQENTEEMTSSVLEESSYPWVLQTQLKYLGKCYVAHQTEGSGMPKRPYAAPIILPRDVRTADEWELVAALLAQNPEKFKAVYRPIRLLILQILSKVVRSGRGIWLARVLIAIPDEADQRIFALKHQDNIRNGDDLVVVLKLLPKTERWALAQKHADKIESGTTLLLVLNELPERARLGFAIICKDKIQGVDDLVFVLGFLSEAECWLFAMICKDKIQNADRLAYTLQCLPKTARLLFAIICKDKIKNAPELYCVLMTLPERAQLGFAMACKDKIQNGEDLGDLLFYLSKPERLGFATICKDKIQDGEQLADVLFRLSKPERLGFATACIDKIEDGKGLASVLEELPEENRQEFITAYEEHIKNQKVAETEEAEIEVCPEQSTAVQTRQSIFTTTPTVQQHEVSGSTPQQNETSGSEEVDSSLVP
nr:hypothetical protein [Chlamydiota bacterium]